MAKSTVEPRSGSHDVQSGAVVRVLRPRRARPAEAARVTRAEINLAFVRHNLRELRDCLKSDADAAGRQPSKLWPVLKADGYGHGATAVAATLEHAGIDGFCVALLEEGIELRESGIESPIIVMGGYYGRFREGVDALLAHQLTPVVYEPGQIEGIANAARYLGRESVGVHLKVDTGMGRLGATADQLDAALSALRRAPQLSLEGFMTHLACADSASLEETHKQLADFDALYERVKRAGFSPRVRHAANSAAMLRLPSAQLDAVRPGIALFGVHPCPDLPSEGTRTPKLKPVMRVLTEIVALRDLPKGTAIGYGHTWRASRQSKIATIPVGYADGLSRALSNRGEVLVAGKRCRIVGTVSMDLTMVDVTDVPGVSLRDEVVVLGQGRGRLGEDVITADEVAAKIGTISWECLTSVSRRVPRFYRHP
jgi:alanine racemase